MSGKFADIENGGMAYVYEHWRPDTNQPFWVGKGSGFRYRVFKRNKHYNSVVAKLRRNGLELEIRMVSVGISHEEAFLIEVERIKFWRNQGVKLANVASGGTGGNHGYKRSAESRAKQSATLKAKGGFSPSHVAALRKASADPERRRLQSKRNLGKKLSEDHRAKISASLMGHASTRNPGDYKWTPEQKARARDRNLKVRKKTSVAMLNQWSNPEMREKMIAGMRRAAAERTKQA